MSTGIRRVVFVALVFGGVFHAGAARAQYGERPINLFGYFQNTFQYQKGTDKSLSPQTSFLLQQLNIIAQKEISKDWSAFVNLEFINSYSTDQRIGDMSIEEAWVRYRAGRRMTVKLGLQIPTFNRLNTIKTKTPLLPYIIRPIVYETSLKDDVGNDEYVPARAFVQVYGIVPIRQSEAKIDYAVYVGNSPNLVSRPRVGSESEPVYGQTGVDSTDYFLVGGRLGFRVRELQAGFSATHDQVDFFAPIKDFLPDKTIDVTGISRIRIGVDASVYIGPFSLEYEFISVHYDESIREVAQDKQFYYITAIVHPVEIVSVYGGYWRTDFDFTGLDTRTLIAIVTTDSGIIEIPTFGAAVNINERITLKAQYGFVDQTSLRGLFKATDFHHSSVAISVFF